MNDSLLDLLSSQLGGVQVQQISNQIGADPAATQKAMAVALPMLLGGLAKQANDSPAQAQSLANALERDHDGSLLDNLGGLGGLGGLLGMIGSGQRGSGGGLGDLLGSLAGAGGVTPKTTDSDGILGHILGGKRSSVEQGVGRASGLDQQQVGKLLMVLAPIVMAALGKMKREKNMDADALTATLNRERATIEEQMPGSSRGSLLSYLDTDGDGDISDDVAKIGAALGGTALLGKLFGGR